MAAKRTDVPINDLVKRYRAGWSVLRLAKHFDISRASIGTRLIKQGIQPRNQSESMFLRMKQATARQRKLWAEAAHDAVRGTKISVGTKELRAQSAEVSQRRQSTYESAIYAELTKRGFIFSPQKAIGIYNCDLAAHSVAVEIFCGGWHWLPQHMRRTPERIRYMLNGGWHVLMVHIYTDRRDRMFDPNWITNAANNIIAYIKKSRRTPTALREYRMIRSTGELLTRGGPNDDDNAVISAFRNAHDLLRIRKRVA